MAMDRGTPTSLTLRLGSGEMTVLALKFTLLPDKLPLNLPSLPFSLWDKVFSGLPDHSDLVLGIGIKAIYAYHRINL